MFTSKYGVAALSLITVQALIVVVFEAVVISYHIAFISNCTLGDIGQGISESDLIYHALFMIAQLFQILLCMDALYQRNSAQLYALVGYDLLVVIYAAIQIYQHFILENVGCPELGFIPSASFSNLADARSFYESMMRPFEYCILVVIPVSFFVLAYFAYHLSKNFTWENYRSYSADIQVRNAAVAFAIFLTILKLDIFFILSFAAQLIPSGLLDYSGSVGETIAVFILGTALIALGFYSVYRESRYGIIGFIAGCFLAVAYFVYRLTMISIPYNPTGLDPYEFTRKFLVFTIVVNIVLLLASIANGIVCFRNMLAGIVIFGSGTPAANFYGPMPSSPKKLRDSNIFTHYPIELDIEGKPPGENEQAAANDEMWTIA